MFYADPYWKCPDNYAAIGDSKCQLEPDETDDDQKKGDGDCESGGGPSGLAGNPVNFTTGNKYQVEHLIATGFPELKFSIYYNSLGWFGDETIGHFWRHNFSGQVIANFNHLDAGAIVRRPDGRTESFVNDNDVWRSASATTGDLQPLMNAGSHVGWIYTTPDNQIETYDADGRLETIKKPSGVLLTLVYNALNELQTITSSRGGQILLTYANAGSERQRIGSVTDTEGHLWKFAYSDSKTQLVSVLFPDETLGDDTDNPRRTYHYEMSSLPNLLTGITDENGHRFVTWEYDTVGDYGRAIKTERASGAHAIDFDYAHLEDSTDPRVTLTNALGKQTTYHFEIVNGVRKIVQVEGHPTANCAGANRTYSYDSNGFLQSKTDWKGNTTTYLRNSKGQEISRTEAVGTPEERTITTEWHPTFNLRTKVTEPDRETTYTYDASGNLLSQHTADATP